MVTATISRHAVRGCLAAALLALVPGGAQGAARKAAAAAAPVTVAYGDLVDAGEMLRSGRRLRETIRDASLAMLQPHLAQYSSLLSFAVPMLAGEDPAPHESVVADFPAGSAQPAWASILREGRIRVTADGRGRARVFLPGDEPREAWRAHYSVVRHPLGRLLPPGGDPLEVEVYAYRNAYRAFELRLNPEPYRFRARSFPPKTAALDLEELQRFFRSGGALEGAELARDEGLVLYARPAQDQALAGQPPTLADFAAAYRAVFHAGDNPAFVSIDPHADPLLGAVNFGGLLEDTRIGAVMLAADKRFKTIVCGLDADTGLDVRAQVRALMPDFLTNEERGLLGMDDAVPSLWMQTRFWFHPGSSGVDVDPQLDLAAVTRAQFAADAERAGVDYVPEEASRRRTQLPAEVRANIRHLNERYEKYAARFAELRELTVVARMVAICSWLFKERPGWLDLDGLLAVELPPVSTARAVPQLLNVEHILMPRPGTVDAAYVARESRVVNVTPLLERSVEEVLRDGEGLEEFFKMQAEAAGVRRAVSSAEGSVSEGARRFEGEKTRKVRDLIRSEADVRALLRALSFVLIKHRLVDDKERLRTMIAERQSLDANEAANEVRIKGLDDEMGAIMRSYHALSGGGASMLPVSVVGYTGGITMSPRLFVVKDKPDSPALKRLKQARGGSSGGPGAGWIRSASTKSGAGRPAVKDKAAASPAFGQPGPGPAKSGKPGTAVKTGKPGAGAAKQPSASSKGSAPAQKAASGRNAAVTDQAAGIEEIVVTPVRQSAPRTVIAARDPTGAAATGRLQPGGKIVFTRAVP